MTTCTLCGRAGHNPANCDWLTPENVERARLEIDEYNAAYATGGELPYPVGAARILAAVKKAA